MDAIGRQPAGEHRWTAGETDDLGPALWGLREDANHVLPGDAICACDDCGQTCYRVWEDGEAVVDAVGLDEVGCHDGGRAVVLDDLPYSLEDIYAHFIKY